MSIEWKVEGRYKGRLIIDRIYKPGRLARFFRRAEKVTHRYIGSGTVWHEYPNGKRAGVFTAWSLSNFVEGLRCQGRLKE